MGRIQIHGLIWAFLFVYLFTANYLYVQLFVKNGKPVDTNVSLPRETKGITYKLAHLEPVFVDGKYMYSLKGYAFLSTNPLQENKISIVLRLIGQSRAVEQNFVFSTQTVPFPNMIESFPGYKKGMRNAEFRMLVTKEGLKSGTYQIGILLEEQGEANRFYINTGAIIKKTPNTFQYKPAPQ